jgi:hypothetical protein
MKPTLGENRFLRKFLCRFGQTAYGALATGNQVLLTMAG